MNIQLLTRLIYPSNTIAIQRLKGNIIVFL